MVRGTETHQGLVRPSFMFQAGGGVYLGSPPRGGFCRHGRHGCRVAARAGARYWKSPAAG